MSSEYCFYEMATQFSKVPRVDIIFALLNSEYTCLACVCLLPVTSDSLSFKKDSFSTNYLNVP